MIAAILPRIAADLAVSIQAAGQLVTVFALTYALSSPVLTALTGGINRRMTLLAAMAAFVVANIVAAAATGYWSLFVARILIAIAAGIYVPGASALAAALVPPERRGRALAIVTGGISLAVALGVPVGALIGTHFGWRTTFVAVGALASAALVGLLIGLPRDVGGGLTSATLQERIAVAVQPAALRTLLVTTLWAMGGYTVYTFIAPYLAAATGIEGGAIGGVLFLWGGAAFAGLLTSGFLTDRLGARRVTVVVLPTMALALLSLSASAHFLAASQAMLPSARRRDRLGCHRLGLLPRAAVAPDRHRRPRPRVGDPLAQRLVHVSRLLARRRPGLAHADPRRRRRPGDGGSNMRAGGLRALSRHRPSGFGLRARSAHLIVVRVSAPPQ